MKYFFLVFLCINILLTMCTKSKESLSVGYNGEDISGIARINRDKKTKAATFAIETTGEWRLYSGTSVEGIDFSEPVLRGEGSGTFQLNVPDSVRSYFELITNKGKAVLAERHLPMTGGYNFRDLGGFKTKEGRFVKWGKILRSDDLHSLTDADLKYLASLPLISIVDFRSQMEVESAPDKNPSTVVKNYPYDINPGNLNSASSLLDLDIEKMDSIMMQVNQIMVTDTSSVTRFKDYFKLLQNKDNVPLLFHCSAGKDRTGMAAALTLFALGVDEETIMEDYLSSNHYLGDKYAQYVAKYPQLKSLFIVKKEYIQTAIRYIKEEYGSVEAYLEKVLQVDIPKLKSLYLY